MTHSGCLHISPRKLWLYMSERKEGIEQIAVGSDVLTQKQDIANGFNHFFHSVFTKMAFTDEDYEMAHACACAMDPVSFDQAGVFQQLLNLNEKKANGPDGIPTVFEAVCGVDVVLFSHHLQKIALDTFAPKRLAERHC